MMFFHLCFVFFYCNRILGVVSQTTRSSKDSKDNIYIINTKFYYMYLKYNLIFYINFVKFEIYQ